MAERQSEQVQQAREDMRHFMGYRVTDELEKAGTAEGAGTITTDEYTRLRARAVK